MASRNMHGWMQRLKEVRLTICPSFSCARGAACCTAAVTPNLEPPIRYICQTVLLFMHSHVAQAGRPIPQSHEDMEKIATQPDNLMTKAFTRRR